MRTREGVVRRTARAVDPDRLTPLQAESWRLLWRELASDDEAAAEARAWIERRRRARPEMLDLVERFLAATIGLEELRAELDARSRTDWDVVGVRGLSGAMFLNRLVRHVGDGDRLAAELRAALAAPANVREARDRLRRFTAFLDEVARASDAALRVVQPARATFFVTLWWHVHSPERWPAFQPSAREVLQREDGLYAPAGDPVEDYVRFRDVFLAVAATLRITTWELEHLCLWRRRGHSLVDEDVIYEPGRLRTPRAVRERVATVPVVREAGREREPAVERAGPHHTHIQWLLARIGKRLGCRVWIAANDHHREWRGEPLGTLSVPRLPSLGLDADAQRIVSMIDVVWLKGQSQVAAAFEVEHTTSVYSGLLRMADLAALSPNLSFPLYIVAPAARLARVRRELERPTFRALGLDRRCAFFTSESLLESADEIMRWAHGPSVMEKLATRVEGGIAR